MIALDTNVVVRLIINDDARQVAAARRLLQQDVLLMTTVVMETEWVLRKTYALSRERVVASIKMMCGLASVTLAEPEIVETSLELHAKGMDFADAVHLCALPEAAQMATFDLDLEKSARKYLGPDKVIIPG